MRNKQIKYQRGEYGYPETNLFGPSSANDQLSAPEPQLFPACYHPETIICDFVVNNFFYKNYGRY